MLQRSSAPAGRSTISSRSRAGWRGGKAHLAAAQGQPIRRRATTSAPDANQRPERPLTCTFLNLFLTRMTVFEPATPASAKRSPVSLTPGLRDLDLGSVAATCACTRASWVGVLPSNDSTLTREAHAPVHVNNVPETTPS